MEGVPNNGGNNWTSDILRLCVWICKEVLIKKLSKNLDGKANVLVWGTIRLWAVDRHRNQGIAAETDASD